MVFAIISILVVTFRYSLSIRFSAQIRIHSSKVRIHGLYELLGIQIRHISYDVIWFRFRQNDFFFRNFFFVNILCLKTHFFGNIIIGKQFLTISKADFFEKENHREGGLWSGCGCVEVVKWMWICGGGEGGEIGKGSQEAYSNNIIFQSPPSTAVLLCMRNSS